MNSQDRAASLPSWLAHWLLYFEWQIQQELRQFAASLPESASVLDAGAGECKHRQYFQAQRYFPVDLAVGDDTWDYHQLAAIADLAALPLRTGSFDAAINIVTLEHVTEPKQVLSEIARCLRPGGRLLAVVPHEWEVHQHPNDYYRYTCFGMRYLLEQSGFTDIVIRPSGGFFRLAARRCLNSLQFFPWPFKVIAFLFAAPAAMILPLFDGLDKRKDFTLGYLCTARKA